MTAVSVRSVEVLAGAGESSKSIAAALARLETAVPTVVLVPDLPPDRDIEDLTDELLSAEVGDTLTGVLGWVQASVPRLRDGGRLVFLLPADIALGRPHSTAASAVTGGLLSMARTLAIELAREDVMVNTVLYVPGVEAALARQVETLATAEASAITGQEIYVATGIDAGRKRP